MDVSGFKGLPGPWFVGETDDNDGYPETVIRGMDGIAGIAVAIDFAKCPGMREANARMIAAAPDLLEALQAVVRVADRATVEFDMARAAIARAIGED
jgi:hypothetical protein